MEEEMRLKRKEGESKGADLDNLNNSVVLLWGEVFSLFSLFLEKK